jgi:hypothetical protein
MKKLAAAIITALLAITVTAAPAQAGPKEVNYILSIGKVAWVGIGAKDQQQICRWYRVSRSAAINEMTSVMMSALDYEYSRADSRRAAVRLLRWGC